MKNIEKHEPVKATLREGHQCYFYEFYPSLDPKLTNVPRIVTKIVQKELIPRGGGFSLQNVKIQPKFPGERRPIELTTVTAAVLRISESTPRDIVERLFKAMQEADFDIGITTEKYAAAADATKDSLKIIKKIGDKTSKLINNSAAIIPSNRLAVSKKINKLHPRSRS